MPTRSCLLLALSFGWSYGLFGEVLYSVTDLGTLAGGSGSSEAAGINNIGQVAGQSNDRAFLYSGGQILDLGTLGGSRSRGQAVNDRGQVTGWAATTSGTNPQIHAFLYSNGLMMDLGT